MQPSTAHAIFWTCAALCATGQGALIWSAIRRYDERSSAYEGDRRISGRRRGERWSADRRTDEPPAEAEAPALRELVWSIVPAVGLALLLAATWAALP